MKQSSTLYLKVTILLMALAILAICVFLLPLGINTDQTGMYRPILIGLYIPAIPYFYALLQGIKILNYIDGNKAFSALSINALMKIKSSAITISLLFGLGMPYIYYVAEKDDAPGVIVAGLVFIFASSVVATFAAVLQRLVQNALDIKAENDLTV